MQTTELKQPSDPNVPIRIRIKRLLADMADIFLHMLKVSSSAPPREEPAVDMEKIFREEMRRSTERLIAKDRELQDHLVGLIQHQKFQTRINHLKQKIQEKDQELEALASAFEQIHSKLSEALHLTRPVVQSIDTKKVAMDNVVSYAHRIAATTSAPFHYRDGEQLKSHAPPHPVEMQWKASLLYPNNLQRFKQELKEMREMAEMEPELEEEKKRKKQAEAQTGASTVSEERGTVPSATIPQPSMFSFFQTPLATTPQQAKPQQKVQLFATDDSDSDSDSEMDEDDS